jgi:hypothetical protein
MAATRTQVSGRAIESTLDQVMVVFRRRIEEALTEQGIDDVNSHRWYPVGQFADVLEMVERDAGEAVVRKLGAAIPESMDWQGSPVSVKEGLDALPDGYRTCHRGLTGGYDMESSDENSATVVCETPYPPEFDKGVIKGTAERFGAGFTKIEELNATPRASGETAHTYEVSW